MNERLELVAALERTIITIVLVVVGGYLLIVLPTDASVKQMVGMAWASILTFWFASSTSTKRNGGGRGGGSDQTDTKAGG